MDAPADQIPAQTNNNARVIRVHHMVQQKIDCAIYQQSYPGVSNRKVELIDPVYLTWKHSFTEVPVAPDRHWNADGATF